MRVGILGPLLVIDEDGREVAVAAPRLRVLLAALVVRANRIVSLDELAELVWDGAPPAAAGSTLRSYLVRLRRTVGPSVAARILTRNPGYLFQLSQDESDVLRFEALCHQAAEARHEAEWSRVPELATRALHEWRDTPLQDVPSQLLRDELTPPMERLRLQALEDRVEAHLRLGNHDTAVPQLRELVMAHPLRERFHGQLISALARSGRQAEALEAYGNARAVLVEELGIEPGPELRAVHQRILTGESELGPALPATAGPAAGPPAETGGPRQDGGAAIVPRQLPAVPEHFTGRVAELDRLTAIARNVGAHAGTMVICTIDGMAGTGKSALAAHWGHLFADRFPDGQLYVDLHGFGPPGIALNAAAAVRGLLGAMAIPQDRIPVGLSALCALYRSVLADRRMLIVLDNARDAAQVRPLLPGSAGCLVLITSRNRLLSLTALEGARSLTVDPLSPGGARDLLARRLGAGRLAAEPQAAAVLIELCARLPLALNIAAARAGTNPGLPLTALIGQLNPASDRLGALDAGDPAASVRVVLSWSYHALTRPAARMFRVLDAHPGPDLTAPAAASLAAVSRAQAHHDLHELASAHLLTEHTPGRYTFANNLVAIYAAEQAHAQDPESERRDAVRRALDHYLYSIGNAVTRLDPDLAPPLLSPPDPGVIAEDQPDGRHALEWLDAEHRILLASAAKAAANGFDTHAWQLTVAVASLLGRHRHWHDLADTLGIGLQATERSGDRNGQALAHRYLGLTLAGLGAYREAYSHFGLALGLVRRDADRVGEADTHLGIAFALGRQDRHRQALKHITQALALARDQGDRVVQARALNAVSDRHCRLGEYQQALAHTRRALDLLHEADSRTGEATAWFNRGMAFHHLGRYRESLTCYGRALGLFHQAHDRHAQAETLIRIGDTHYLLGSEHAARDAWQQALAILEEIRHPDADQLRRKLHHGPPGLSPTTRSA